MIVGRCECGCVGARCVGVRERCDAGAVRAQVLERQQAHDDEQRAAEHFAAALDVRRNRPADEDDGAGAEGEQERVAEREARRDARSLRRDVPRRSDRRAPSIDSAAIAIR